MNSSSPRRIARLHDPNIPPWIRLLEFLEVAQKVAVFVGKDVSFRHEVEVLSPELILHFHEVKAKTVLPRDFIRLWKVVDPLVLIQSFV